MLSVNTSYSLMVGQRSLMNAQGIIAQAAERLMTGSRINRTSDDPAGSVAVSAFEAQAKMLNQDIDKLDQRAALLGAKEGVYSVVNDLLIELEGTVVQAANTGGLNQEEREALQTRADSIIEAIDHVYMTARFRGESLFDSAYTLRAGGVDIDRPGDSIDGGDEETRHYLAEIRSGGALNLIDGDLEAAQESVGQAVKGIARHRATIGAVLTNEIEALRNAKLTELENITQARSQIEDADFARETTELVRGQILQQASIFAILFSRQSPQSALQLLESSVNIAKNT